ncbi:GAF domain-containing protein [Williamsia sp. CHRR-6]|uniref:GAF domain-containing protein n=1 Tax=Williamsia sp. CHRR-6 TaxID=2835871 RepID=UPI001BDB505B|nr:GAF domain-containing protein [Williamsia sp. CHRR-6]MBT0568229.1 GAF domain-containing protein [Williamsia sp. CHRR-6]
MSDHPVAEPALVAGDDPREHARTLAAVYDATMSGARAPARPRSIISSSWDRLLSMGVDPDQLAGPVSTLDATQVQARRHESGLIDVIDDLTLGLGALLEEGDNILVVADGDGRVLWRSGSAHVIDQADRLGFIEGASWAEHTVGTNAIGTALVSRRAVQVFSAEHFVRSHHPWTCAGAPIHDPRSGSVIGAVDVSGPAATIHPTTVALVDVVARLAESHLRELHRSTLDRLRAVAAPILARTRQPSLAVDRHGWVAAVESVASRHRVTLPDEMHVGRVYVPTLGLCDVEPLPGGWLVAPVRSTDVVAHMSRRQIRIDLSDTSRPLVCVDGAIGSWTHEPTPRHAEILYLLATHRDGRTASQMAADLFGDPTRTVTVRAELSRLRKQLTGMLLSSPYRFVDDVDVDVRLPECSAWLLPNSTAPAIRNAGGQ